MSGADHDPAAAAKHLAVLAAANLVGREKLHYLNPVPIQEIADRWIGKFAAHRLRALSALTSKLEERDE